MKLHSGWAVHKVKLHSGWAVHKVKLHSGWAVHKLKLHSGWAVNEVKLHSGWAVNIFISNSTQADICFLVCTKPTKTAPLCFWPYANSLPSRITRLMVARELKWSNYPVHLLRMNRYNLVPQVTLQTWQHCMHKCKMCPEKLINQQTS